MTNQKPCEYNHPSCQKIATIQHYLPHSNFTKDGWTCANCWAVIIKTREINHE
jgi:hypothetical protein